MEKKKKKVKKVNPIPKGMRTVTPYLLTNDAGGLIKFMKNAFAGKLTYIMKAKGKVMHATVKIGDSIVMTGDAPEPYQPMPCQLYLYIDDVDSIYKKAIKAGGISVREPVTEFYGDRSAAVKDNWGNIWWMATHVEDVSDEEMKKREKEFRMQELKKAKDVK